MKADQHAAFFRHHARRQPRAETIAPERPVNRRIELLCRDATEVPEIGFEHALLGRHLALGGKMLHAAATAHPEMRAFRLDAVGGRLDHPQHACVFIGWLLTIAGEFNFFARQGTIDENGLAFQPRDAPPFVIQRFDNSDRHAMPLQKGCILARRGDPANNGRISQGVPSAFAAYPQIRDVSRQKNRRPAKPDEPIRPQTRSPASLPSSPAEPDGNIPR